MSERIANTTFGGKEATQSYGAVAKLSIGYRASIAGISEVLIPFLKTLNNKGIVPDLLEVGGGQGTSAWALKKIFRDNKVFRFIFTGTEFVLDQIRKGHNKLNEKIDLRLIPPKIQVKAEELPFSEGKFDAVVGSQMIHWLETKEALKQHFSDALRVLKPGGKLVHATSGIVDLEQYNASHFTRHPFVLNAYLPALEKELTKKGYWKKENGEFVPWNPKVNPAYHKFTLNMFREILEEVGFKNIQIHLNMAPLNRKEIKMRLTNLAFLNMHFFTGEFAKNISPKERVRMAKKAYREACKNMTDGILIFSSLPQEVIIGEIPEGSFGEPVPVITADKPS
ncbi:MAG: class I SAM-dependent methyltransferase [Patescibacteria group bacterium]